jgi:hypothetical protein
MRIRKDQSVTIRVDSGARDVSKEKQPSSNEETLIVRNLRGAQRTSLHRRRGWWRFLSPGRGRWRRSFLAQRQVGLGPGCGARHDTALAASARAWWRPVSSVVLVSIGSGVIVLVLICKSVGLSDGTQVAATGQHCSRFGRDAGESVPGGRIVAHGAGRAIKGRMAAVCGAVDGRGVAMRRQIAGGELGNRDTRCFRFRLFLA